MKGINALIVTMMVTSLMVVQSVFAGTAENTEVPFKYEVERTVLHSNNMTITGENVRFINLTDTELQNELNKVIEAFYDEVLQAAAEGGIPYPQVNFVVTADEFDTRYTLNITSKTSYAGRTGFSGLQIVIEGNQYNVLKSAVTDSDVLSITADEESHYVMFKEETALVPFRYVSEFFGYTVTWNGKSAKAEKGNRAITVTPGVNEYSGRQLEHAPDNRSGKIFVPISVFRDVLDLHCTNENGVLMLAVPLFSNSNTQRTTHSISYDISEHPESLPSNSEDVEVIGTIVDVSSNKLTIMTRDGEQYNLTNKGININALDGVALDAYVRVIFTGDKDNAAVIKTIEPYSVNEGSPDPGVTTVIATVQHSSPINGLKVKTLSGRELVFYTNYVIIPDAIKGNIASEIAVEFTGDIRHSLHNDLSIVNIIVLEPVQP